MKRNKLITNNQKYLGNQHFPEGVEEIDLEIENEGTESVFDPNTKKTSIKQVVYFKNPPVWFPKIQADDKKDKNLSQKPLPMIINNTNVKLILQHLKQNTIYNFKGLFVTVGIAYIMRPKEIIIFDDKNYEHKITEKVVDNKGKEKSVEIRTPCLRIKNAWYPDPAKIRQKLREVLNEYLPKFKSASIEDFENKVGKIEDFDFQTATKHFKTYTNLLKEAEKNNN